MLRLLDIEIKAITGISVSRQAKANTLFIFIL
jgi:hypothetical protein